MPNLITHIFASEEVLESLPSCVKDDIFSTSDARSAYILGAIGPDFLFSLRELGLDAGRLPNRMHTSKQAETFVSLVDVLRAHPDNIKTAYVLGLAAHYALDSAIHPYVYGMCESYVGYALDGVSLPTAHQLIESALDEYVLENAGVNPTNAYNARRAISARKSVRLAIGELYRDAVSPVYGIAITPREASLGFELTGLAMGILRDVSGKRAARVRVAEKILWDGKRKITALMHPPYGYGKIDYLNFERKPFRIVRNRAELSNATCIELLEEAKNKAANVYIPHIYHAIKSASDLDMELFAITYDGTHVIKQ